MEYLSRMFGSENANTDAEKTDENGSATETNFMGMQNYKLSPMEQLRMVACSSIFGEPSYYRDSKKEKSYVSRHTDNLDISKYLLFQDLNVENTVDLFTKVIDAALDHDFEGTIQFALRLRQEFLMRLNPSVILVRAALHPKREEFNKTHPKVFREIVCKVAQRPDDLTNQLKYYVQLTGDKKNLPGVLKRAWADRLQETSRYQLKKYLNRGNLIDLVRVCHANSADINEMMKTGDIEVAEDQNTWESLRSQGKSWEEIVNTIRMPHMALLRNLRGMAKEITDGDKLEILMKLLKEGVKGGKQFPFRYYSAYQAVQSSNDIKENCKEIILKGLNECIHLAMDNFPVLKGKTISLCDNSGSAWGALNSQYGTVKVAEIANLSGIMTAINSDVGEVGIFGDRLEIENIPKDTNILSKLHHLSEKVGKGIGGGTEHGIWLFFRDAIDQKKHYDNIFIYSDMQAGHGGLYGTGPEYTNRGYACGRSYSSNYINVMKLIEDYRLQVNPRVNIFSVQVAGYNNQLIPEMFYRGSILAGWTGNEVLYAQKVTELWDEFDQKYQSLKK